ncbi:dCTP deaminase [Bradyrhizobium sp. CER78]|uniref:dCTP deaminase n=1 Tax=Bradyrhizobium sp. CER78 TaxID=3039162 RepID=UPI00244B9743|nr:dCTP deaminase [Bradyrhizobium sp. CER78]MDH2382745.1 dCTP deaminase [Bradyrhizobium sp. CER78]
MLNTDEVKRRLHRFDGTQSDGIVIVPNPFEHDATQIGRTSIDLRLGRWFSMLQQTKTSAIDFGVPRNENAFSASEGRSSFVPFGHPFVLHPGRFVLASTFEWLSLPNDVAAYISGKSALGRMGLIIETAAGIHPGFSGSITLELFNCGEVPIRIYPGMPVCQLFFHQVDGAVSKENSAKGTKFGGRRKPAFGSYKPDDALSSMLDVAAIDQDLFRRS